jgi:hypothetical protein
MNETPTLRRNAAWHHDLVPFPVFTRAQNNAPTSNHTYINSSYTFNIRMLQEAPHFSLRLKELQTSPAPLRLSGDVVTYECVAHPL